MTCVTRRCDGYLRRLRVVLRLPPRQQRIEDREEEDHPEGKARALAEAFGDRVETADKSEAGKIKNSTTLMTDGFMATMLLIRVFVGWVQE